MKTEDERTSFYCVIVRHCQLLRALIIGEWMNLEHPSGDTERKSAALDGHVSECHFVQHKSHMNWPGIESGPPQ